MTRQIKGQTHQVTHLDQVSLKGQLKLAELETRKAKVEEAIKARRERASRIAELKLKIAREKVKKREIEVLNQRLSSSADTLAKVRAKARGQQTQELRLR